MEMKDQLWKRVQEAAEDVMRTADGGINVPIEDHVDKSLLTGLCDSLSRDPDQWDVEDLGQILVIRDGLYYLRNKLRDEGEDAEYSVDRFIGTLDRLYTDLQRALQALNPTDVEKAQSDLAELQSGPRINATQLGTAVPTLEKHAGEVLTQAHITQKNISFTLIDLRNASVNVNVDLFRKVKLEIQKFSASAVAIKVQLAKDVIYEGIFRFLHEKADDYIERIKKGIQALRQKYEDAKEFLSDLSQFAEQGSRFVQLVGQFIELAFEDDRTAHQSLEFHVQSYFQSEPLNVGIQTSNEHAMLGGRRGEILILNVPAARVADRYQGVSDHVSSMCRYNKDLVVVGHGDGFDLIKPLGQSADATSVHRRGVTSVAVAPAAVGGQANILTGSNDGMLRRWSFAVRLAERDSRRMGRHIAKVIALTDTFLVASGNDLVAVDPKNLEMTGEYACHFRIEDMIVIGREIILCGYGHLATMEIGTWHQVRLLSASSGQKYRCLTKLTDGIFCVGTDEGRISAIELGSGRELGTVEVGFSVRGMVPFPRKIVALGGDWNSKSGRTGAFITWKSVVEGDT